TIVQPGPFINIRQPEPSSDLLRVETDAVILDLQPRPIVVNMQGYSHGLRLTVFQYILGLFLYDPEKGDFFTLIHLFQIGGPTVIKTDLELLAEAEIVDQIV